MYLLNFKTLYLNFFVKNKNLTYSNPLCLNSSTKARIPTSPPIITRKNITPIFPYNSCGSNTLIAFSALILYPEKYLKILSFHPTLSSGRFDIAKSWSCHIGMCTIRVSKISKKFGSKLLFLLTKLK